MISSSDAKSLARALAEVRAAGRTRRPLTEELDLDLESAYEIQEALTELRVRRGERPVGWKLGYTSEAMRRQLGIAQPNFGRLTDAMVLEGGRVPPSAIQPRVEPEVGLRLAHDIGAGADRGAVASSVAEAVACLEVVDSVFEGYRFRLEDNTADGSSAAWVVVGPALPIRALEDVSVRFERNGEVVGSGVGRDAGGHPFDAVAWLAGQLAERGKRLMAGDLVITGGLTAMVELMPGDEVRALFGAVEVRVTR